MKRKRSNKQSSREAAPPTSSIASLAAPTALKEEDLVKIEQVVKEELAENNLKKSKHEASSSSSPSSSSETSNKENSNNTAMTTGAAEDEKKEEPPKPKFDMVQMSTNDKSQKITVGGDDNLLVVGEKGYRMGRATHGISSGEWYYEVTFEQSQIPTDISSYQKILKTGFQPHMRVGWSTDNGDKEAPVGFDRFSYSYRDVEGTKFHESTGEPYGEPFTQGDVIGVHIYLPSPYNKNKKKKNKGKGNKNRRKSLSSHTSDSTYNRSQNQQHLLALLDIGSSRRGTQTWMGLPLAGSRITFYKNGISQGVAFKDISRGTYYPAVSNYLFARSKMNFGPTYLFPPQDLDLDKMRDQWMINNPHLRGQIALGDPFSTSVFYPVRRTRNTTSTSQAHNSSSSNGSSNSSSSNHKDSSSSSSSSSNGENGRSTGKKNKENEKVKFGAWQGQCKDSVLVRNPNHKFTHAQAQ